jgi:hypothetical protein
MADRLIGSLIAEMAALPASDRVFNPYDASIPGGDIRQANLARYLSDMLARSPHVLMLFEAPGYRGCAWSGIPVTSERIMLRGIPKWGLFGEGYQATSEQPEGVAEMTATIVWGALEAYANEPPLIWNTVPVHPHRVAERQSNRTPTAEEQRMGMGPIEQVIGLFGFETLLAVGRTAQEALAALGYEAVPLRHPSQGGKPEFTRGLAKALARNRGLSARSEES